MNIVKYKRSSNGKYKIELDGNNELVLYEEVILKNELLLKKEIGEQLISILLEENREWEAYYIALKSLKAHFRSGKELSDILLKKDYPQELVDKTINKLLDQGYINDTSFSRSYINNQMMTTNKGPNKIINELLNKGVILEIVQKEISIFNEDIQRKKINKLINKAIKSNKSRAGIVLKKKIINDLINLGYESFLISNIINNFSFSSGNDILKKEYEKLYKKLSKKYSGSELKYKIKQKLYQKGFVYEGEELYKEE